MIKYNHPRSQNRSTPRPYRMVNRRVAVDKNRERILSATRAVLLAEDFSEFSMDAIARKAGVIRPTLYYQFHSKSGLLEELYNYIARRGNIHELAAIFQKGNDAVQWLHEFIRFFVGFWQSDRDLIRRLHGLGAIDSEIGQGLRARNERRRNGLRVIVERYEEGYRSFNALERPVVIDTLHMLTSFETFDALANEINSEAVVDILQKHANYAIKFIRPVLSPRY